MLDVRGEKLIKQTFLNFQPLSEFLENPLVLERANGLYYWDTSGKQYFDGISGLYTVSLGHQNPKVTDALITQLQKLSFSPPMHGIASITLDYIEKLSSITPGNLNSVKLVSGGSESIEAAIKFSRQYFRQVGLSGKYKFISFYSGYHGATLGALSAGGVGERSSKFEPLLSGFIKVFPPSYYNQIFSSWEDSCSFCAKAIENVILGEDPSTIAGILVEPILNTGGIIIPSNNFFAQLRNLCDQHKIMLIFDEVITGFGRTGFPFAAQTFGVLPDIICSGKALTNGTIPAGAMIVRDDYAEIFVKNPDDGRDFVHGHTFSGQPLSAAAGLVVLNEIASDGLREKTEASGRYLEKKLTELRKHGVIKDVRGRGLLYGVELTDSRLGIALKKTSLSNGVVLRINPTWFAVAPAIISTKEDIDDLMFLIEKSLLDAIEMI